MNCTLFLQFCTKVWVDFHTLGSVVSNDITLIFLVIFALLLALKTTPSFDKNFNSQIVFCDQKKQDLYFYLWKCSFFILLNSIIYYCLVNVFLINFMCLFSFRLEQVLEYAEDIEIDIPQLWNYLGELLGPTAFDGNIDLKEFFKCVLKYVPKHKAAKLFAYMLQTATNDTVSWI